MKNGSSGAEGLAGSELFIVAHPLSSAPPTISLAIPTVPTSISHSNQHCTGTTLTAIVAIVVCHCTRSGCTHGRTMASTSSNNVKTFGRVRT